LAQQVAPPSPYAPPGPILHPICDEAIEEAASSNIEIKASLRHPEGFKFIANGIVIDHI